MIHIFLKTIYCSYQYPTYIDQTIGMIPPNNNQVLVVYPPPVVVNQFFPLVEVQTVVAPTHINTVTFDPEPSLKVVFKAYCPHCAQQNDLFLETGVRIEDMDLPMDVCCMLCRNNYILNKMPSLETYYTPHSTSTAAQSDAGTLDQSCSSINQSNCKKGGNVELENKQTLGEVTNPQIKSTPLNNEEENIGFKVSSTGKVIQQNDQNAKDKKTNDEFSTNRRSEPSINIKTSIITPEETEPQQNVKKLYSQVVLENSSLSTNNLPPQNTQLNFTDKKKDIKILQDEKKRRIYPKLNSIREDKKHKIIHGTNSPPGTGQNTSLEKKRRVKCDKVSTSSESSFKTDQKKSTKSLEPAKYAKNLKNTKPIPFVYQNLIKSEDDNKIDKTNYAFIFYEKDENFVRKFMIKEKDRTKLFSEKQNLPQTKIETLNKNTKNFDWIKINCKQTKNKTNGKTLQKKDKSDLPKDDILSTGNKFVQKTNIKAKKFRILKNYSTTLPTINEESEELDNEEIAFEKVKHNKPSKKKTSKKTKNNKVVKETQNEDLDKILAEFKIIDSFILENKTSTSKIKKETISIDKNNPVNTQNKAKIHNLKVSNFITRINIIDIYVTLEIPLFTKNNIDFFARMIRKIMLIKENYLLDDDDRIKIAKVFLHFCKETEIYFILKEYFEFQIKIYILFEKNMVAFKNLNIILYYLNRNNKNFVKNSEVVSDNPLVLDNKREFDLITGEKETIYDLLLKKIKIIGYEELKTENSDKLVRWLNKTNNFITDQRNFRMFYKTREKSLTTFLNENFE
ncbi:hypothetical protein TUBRATIS_29210 [Tubulinosema ratisbonensis]|uniref:Uncharacterized protein n=1 Tax=Tubulinosema ratisbonensis TaxID=291195 RepID=A0A437AHS4_9MICR|nr:hypothetical protein TUBRATIS_29210 [Tubulinosema ratisbonensis]